MVEGKRRDVGLGIYTVADRLVLCFGVMDHKRAFG